MKRIQLSLIVLVSILFCQCTSDQKSKVQEEKPQVKNVILMIGDGMGVSQVYAGMTANKGSLYLEKSQFVGLSKTYSADRYITDSAAGGTAIATGTKPNGLSVLILMNR